jgi:hypothetical protein
MTMSKPSNSYYFTDKHIDYALSKLYYEKKSIAAQTIILYLGIICNRNTTESLNLIMAKERLAEKDKIGCLIISKRGIEIMDKYGGWIEYVEYKNHLKRIKKVEYLGFWAILIGGVYYLLEIIKIIISCFHPSNY